MGHIPHPSVMQLYIKGLRIKYMMDVCVGVSGGRVGLEVEIECFVDSPMLSDIVVEDQSHDQGNKHKHKHCKDGSFFLGGPWSSNPHTF